MLGAMLALMLEAGPPAAPKAQPTTAAPAWLKVPDPADFAPYYPASAAMRGITGRAVLNCTVTAAGVLVDCEAVEESPPGEGFGEAVVRMAHLFRMRPMTKDGQPVAGGKVRIPIQFAAPGGKMDSLSVTLKCYGRTAVAADVTPRTEEAWNAARTWLSQALVLYYQSSSKLSSLEQSLHQAHVDAEAEKDPKARPTLEECVAAIQKVGPAGPK
jgi:TonB family protein